MKLKLTASEHLAIGPALVILTRSVQSADVLNEFKRNRDILKRLRRAARELPGTRMFIGPSTPLRTGWRAMSAK